MCYTTIEYEEMISSIEHVIQVWDILRRHPSDQAVEDEQLTKYVQVQREILLLKAMLLIAHCDQTLFPCDRLRSKVEQLEHLSGIF